MFRLNKIIFTHVINFVPFQPSYSYAVAVFSGERCYQDIEHLLINQEICSIIACKGTGNVGECGKRYTTPDIHYRFNITKLHLDTLLPNAKAKIMPNSLTQDLLPFQSTEFNFKV